MRWLRWISAHPEVSNRTWDSARSRRCNRSNAAKMNATSEEFDAAFDLCMREGYGLVDNPKEYPLLKELGDLLDRGMWHIRVPVLVHYSTLHHKADTLQNANIGQGITINRDNISIFSRFNCSHILHPPD